MIKKYKFIDEITTLFVFVMTCIVVFILTVAQSNDTNLTGKSLFLFLFGFFGSMLCIIVRFIILYSRTMKESRAIRRIFIVSYLIVWSILFVLMFCVVLQESNFSIEHIYLWNYNAYQNFMLVILIAQWLPGKFLNWRMVMIDDKEISIIAFKSENVTISL